MESEELKRLQAILDKKGFGGKGMRRRTFAYLWLFIGMLAMLVASSFAWFGISTTPRVSEMAIYVNVPVGMQVATTYDAAEEDWGLNISFTDLISDKCPLKPATWSAVNQCFKAIRYGKDGRQSNKWRKLTDEQNANTTGNDQYYVYGTFYARTDTGCTVSLADAVALSGGLYGAGTFVIGQPEWDAETQSHTDTGYGAEYAVRIGFRISTIDAESGAIQGESEFYIYEPNADTHLDGTTQYLTTSSIDGTGSLVDEEHLLVQSTSGWREADPVQENVTIKTLGEFTEEKDLFQMEVEEIVRIDLYIWIEGQDIDCYGLPEEANLLANIQFNADYSGHSGLEDIEKE